MPLSVAAELETKRYLPSRLKVQAAGWLKPVRVWTHLALMRSGLTGPGTSMNESGEALELSVKVGVTAAWVVGAGMPASGSVGVVELTPVSRSQPWIAAAANASDTTRAAVRLR